jgi:hypothetical protein
MKFFWALSPAELTYIKPAITGWDIWNRNTLLKN